VGDGPVTLVYLCLEVAGCPTVCRHCWAQGNGYGMMPLAEIEWVLARAHEYCDGRGLGFDSYPMHELAAHPDAAELFGLFNSHSGTVAGGTMFEPWPTTGVSLALREDWRDVLRAAAGTGTEHVWLAFHGTGEVHDRQVSRRGAYAESCLAAERAREAGLGVGCNVFLTRDSLPQLDELIGAVGRLADEGVYRTRHGNLRTDGVATVLGRALERGRERDDELWFGPGPLPAPDELAARYGDADGLGVHMGPESARYLWLDRAGRAGCG